MKKVIFISLTLFLASLLLFAVPSSHTCPLCGGTMIWTGNTQTEWGKMTYEMKCPIGHTSWEVDANQNSSNNSSSSYSSTTIKCQYCGLEMYYTGDNQIEFGTYLYKYKCAAGHVCWVKK